MPAENGGKEPSAPPCAVCTRTHGPGTDNTLTLMTGTDCNQYTLHGYSHGEQKVAATLWPEQPH